MTAYRMQMVFKCSFSFKELNRITQQLDGGKLIVNNAKELVLTQTLTVVPTEELIRKYEEAIRISWPKDNDLCIESVKFDRYNYITPIEISDEELSKKEQDTD